MIGVFGTKWGWTAVSPLYRDHPYLNLDKVVIHSDYKETEDNIIQHEVPDDDINVSCNDNTLQDDDNNDNDNNNSNNNNKIVTPLPLQNEKRSHKTEQAQQLLKAIINKTYSMPHGEAFDRWFCQLQDLAKQADKLVQKSHDGIMLLP